MENNKGFTLVELLAVIVILAIIMIIAIPAVLDTMDSAKRKSFVTYVDKINTLSVSKFLKDNLIDENKGDGCYIYNIENDLELNNTGDFKGYILLSINRETVKYYLSIWSNDYMLIAYNYTDSITYDGKNKSVLDALEPYSESRKGELTPGNLCNYACSQCTYENASNDTNNPDNNTPSSFTGDPTKVFGATNIIDVTDFRKKVKTVAGDFTNIKYIKRSKSLNESAIKEIITESTGTSAENPVYIWFEDGTLYFYSDATKIFMPENSAGFFSGFTALINCNDFLLGTSGEKIKNMSTFFKSDMSLESADLSNWNTPNLIKTNSFFYGCTSLREVKVNNLNVSKVEELDYFFYHCESLETIDITKWNTSNVKSFYAIFTGCTGLKSLDLTKLDTSSAENFGAMFKNVYLDYIDISNFKTQNVTSISAMFYGTKSSSLDFSRWSTPKLNDLTSAFYACKTKELNLSTFNTSKVTLFKEVFNTSKAEIIDITSWDSRNVTNMYRMFADCFNLRHIYVGDNWSVEGLVFKEGVENTSSMFHRATLLPNYNPNYRDHTKAYVGEGGYLENRP